MRVLSAFVLCVALVSAPAAAKKPRAQPGTSSTLVVVVLPFVGKGSSGAEAKDAIELELELVEQARVEVSQVVESDVAKAGSQAFEAGILSPILVKRRIDVLVRGVRAPGRDGSDVLLVTAYARDGVPRMVKELQLNLGADRTAAVVMEALGPALANWRKLKALPGPVRQKPAPEELYTPPEPRVSTKPEKPEKKPQSPPRIGPAHDVDGDDGPHLADLRPSDDELAPLTVMKPAEPERPSDSGGVVDGSSKPKDGEPKLTHLFSIGALFDGGGWQYQFTGDDRLQSLAVILAPDPGGNAHLDFWPIEYVGIDASFAASTIRFIVADGGNAQIDPSDFRGLHVAAAASLKGRYVLKSGLPGLAFGGRLGYRFWSGIVPPQKAVDDKQLLTVAPGFTLHALAIGPELSVPFILFARRLEIELKADVMPLTFYTESPDNPGAQSLAFGWSGVLAARYDIFAGAFVEIAGSTTGVAAQFTGIGDRRSLARNANGERALVAGGQTVNFTAAASIGVGFFY